MVGPNGVGKSNLSDAIRWVLGESSARTLRGERMEDVIFAGSDARRPLPLAEVSVTLDNSDRFLPIGFSEVMMTRRVDRAGSSEYLLNRANCRQRDFADLLHGTGLGRHNFAVVSQGQADELLADRPEQLRAVIEEAAGITRYRARRAEAERHLAAAGAARERLGDLLAERERQLPELAAEAERARRHRALAEELRGIELALWARELAQLRQRRLGLEQAVVTATGRLEAAERAWQEASADLGRLEAEQTRARAAWDQRREAEHALAARIERARQDGRLAAALAERLEGEQARLEEQTAEARARLAGWEQEAASRARQREEVERAITAAAAEVAAVRAAAGQSAAARQQAAQRTGALEAELAALRRTQERLRAAPARSERDTALRAAAHAEAELAAARTAAAAAQQAAAQARAEREAAERAVAEARAEVLRRRSAVARVRERLTAATSRAGALREMIRHGAGLAQGPRTVLGGKAKGLAAFAGILGTLAQLLEVPPDLAVAIDAALGGAGTDLVAVGADAAAAAIAALKERRGGRATFLPLGALSEPSLPAAARSLAGRPGVVGWAADLVDCEERVRPAVAHVLGRVLVAEDLAAARSLARQSGFRIRIVTRDGDVVHAGGAMTGGWLAGERRGGSLGQEAEAARLRREAAELAEAVRAEEAELAAATARVEAAEAAGRLAGQNAAQAAAEAAAAAALLQRLEGEVRRARNRAKALSAGEVRDEGAIAAAGVRAGELEREIGAARTAEREAAEADLQARAALQAALGQSQALDRQRADADAWTGRLDEERTRIATQLAELDAAGGKLDAERSEHLAAAERAGRTAAELGAQAEAAAREAADLRQRLLAVEQEAGIAARARGRADGLRSEAERILRAAEVERARAEAAETGLAERLRQAYAMELAELAGIAPAEHPGQARERGNALRGDLAAMGEVDPGAVQKFQHERERAQRLKGRLDDVDAATIICRTWIDRIERRMQTAYQETLEAVRQEFAGVYRRLFGGGTADLLAVGEGLQIAVQPPGKRAGPLPLLSGGERALCGVALLFALLRLRPASFCVLDEVDAALDDANVVRLGAFLREWSEAGTQFIVVTHQRATMEAADRLIGVTLSDGGASHLVSLRLPEAPAAAGAS